MDNTKVDRRTVLVTRELERYDIDIIAHSETYLPNESQITETGGSYKFIWIGCNTEKCHKAGVGFAIKNHLVHKLTRLPKSVK